MSLVLCLGTIALGVLMAPNDPDFDKQWALENIGQAVNGVNGIPGSDIKAQAAWDLHAGARPVIVAIIGAGVNPHEEFADRVLPGYVSSLAGGDPYSTLDIGQNGTRAAGVIAAKRDNGIGIAGLNDHAIILPVRVASNVNVSAESVAEGLTWAADHGAEIALVLIQFSESNQALADAVSYAFAHGVLVVAPAGHDGSQTVAFPAAYEDCLAVSATTNEDQIASFSNSGPEVDLAAPGEWIWSTIGLDSYGYGNEGDTFLPAAYVAGVASLMRSYSPGISAMQIREILLQNADDLGDTGVDEIFGAGRLNAYGALKGTPIPLLRMEPLAPIPASVPPMHNVSFPIRIVNGTGTLNPTSPELVYRFGPGPFTNSTRLQLVNGSNYSAVLPAIPCESSIDFYLIASALSGLTVTDPANAPADLHHLVVDPEILIFEDDFEDDQGWEATTIGAGTTGAWVRDEPIGTFSNVIPVQPEFDRSEDHGSLCYFTGQHSGGSIGSNDVDLGPVILTSPTIDISQYANVELQFACWLYTSIGTPDSLTVQISRDNGATWTTASLISATDGWEFKSLSLNDFPNAIGTQLRVRFTISDIPSDSLTEAAVDEFRVFAYQCEAIQGDLNGDGIVNMADMGVLGGCMTGPQASLTGNCTRADANGDSHVDLRDASVLFSHF